MNINTMEGTKLNIVQAVKAWLPLTENWIFNQVRFLPSTIGWHIVTERILDEKNFAVKNIDSMLDGPPLRSLERKALHRAGVLQYDAFVAKRAREFSADAIHTHFGNIACELNKRIKEARIAHIVSFYGFDATKLPYQDKRWAKRYSELFKQIRLVLCEGPCMADTIAALGCPPERIAVNALGVEIERIEFRPRSWEPGQPFRVLMASSFREKKGLSDGIRALGLLSGEIDIELTIIGDSDGEARSQYEKARIVEAIRDAGLADKVRLLGYQPAETLYREALQHHLFLAPSVTAHDGDSEGGLPVLILEMAASGILIVSTRHCDIPQAVRDGKTGLLADEHDIAGLAENIRWFIKNPDKWGTMLTEGRRHIESDFNAYVQSQRLAGIYEALLG